MSQFVGIGDGTNGVVLHLKLFALNDFRCADDDSAGVEVVVESLAFPQKLRCEYEVELFAFQLGVVLETVEIFHIHAPAETNGDGAFDDHHRVGVDVEHQVDDLFHVFCVEIIAYGVIVGRSGNHHEVRIFVCRCSIKRCGQRKRFLTQVFLDVFIIDGRFVAVEHLYFFCHHIYGCHFVFLGKQCRD